MTMNYGIDDSWGHELTTGLPEHTARAVAQKLADERGEPVYLYPMTGPDHDSHAEEFAPSVQAMKDVHGYRCSLRDVEIQRGTWVRCYVVQDGNGNRVTPGASTPRSAQRAWREAARLASR